MPNSTRSTYAPVGDAIHSTPLLCLECIRVYKNVMLAAFRRASTAAGREFGGHGREFGGHGREFGGHGREFGGHDTTEDRSPREGRQSCEECMI